MLLSIAKTVKDKFPSSFVKAKNSKCLQLASICLVLGLVLYWSLDELSWIFSALGRLVLIELLPYWNWQRLYSAKCLIERPNLATVASQKQMVLGRHETLEENCGLCLNLDHIPVVRNTSFSYLEALFLERGSPVIIEDALTPSSFSAMAEKILDSPADFLKSEPCDLATNLMMKKFFSIELAVEKIKHLERPGAWFLQLRNCQFKAVKASRSFITRPYFYPLHFEPFYSSWLLMFQGFKGLRKDIYVQGLVIIQQVSGSTLFELKAKQPCDSLCPNMKLDLREGESLVFSSDLWMLSYSGELSDPKTIAIATIMEIDWQN